MANPLGKDSAATRTTMMITMRMISRTILMRQRREAFWQRRRDGRDVLSVRTAADLLMRRTSQSHSLHRSQDVLR